MPPTVSTSMLATPAPKPAALHARPIDRKNMLATQCSKPMATNAAMGSRMPTTLSTTVRAPKPIHTARHTNTLHRIALNKRVTQSSATLPAARLTNESPTAPAFIPCRLLM